MPNRMNPYALFPLLRLQPLIPEHLIQPSSSLSHAACAHLKTTLLNPWFGLSVYTCYDTRELPLSVAAV